MMSMAGVQCAKCNSHEINSSQSAKGCFCCTRYHILCRSCMFRKKMICPICDASIEEILPDTTSASSDTLSDNDISSIPQEENNKLTNCEPKPLVCHDKTDLIQMNATEAPQLVIIDESQAMELLKAMQSIQEQPNKQNVEKTDSSQQTVDEDEPALAEFFSTEVENQQLSYSKPICAVLQNINDEPKELDTGKETTSKQDIYAVIKVQCLKKLAEALHECSGTLEALFITPQHSSVPAPTPSTFSPPKAMKNNRLEELEEKLVNTYLYKCTVPVLEAANPYESRMTPLCVSHSKYQPPAKTYITDALTRGLPLKVSYMPCYCPDGDYFGMISAVDVIQHFIEGHPRVPKECIKLDQLKTFTLDAYYLAKKDTCAVAMLYVLHEPGLQLSIQRRYENCLPILVVTRYADLGEVLGETSAVLKTQDYLLVWLVGLVLHEVHIQGNLLLIDDGDGGSGNLLVSTSVYSLRESQDPRSVYENGKPLMIRRKLVDKMTKNGKEPLKLQIILK